MYAQPFLVQGLFGPSRGIALGQYRPLTIKQDGERVRNPKFDQHSQHILNIKDPNKGWFKGSVQYCSNLVIAHAATMTGFAKAQIIIVPSSEKGKVSQGLERIARNLCSADNRFVYTPGALVRTKTIDKLARGGDRSLHIHLESLEYKRRDQEIRTKIVFDDVCTSSHSLSGAISVMQQVLLDQVEAHALVLGKTTRD